MYALMKRTAAQAKSGSAGSAKKWQRCYKACMSCRNRKMKCDMGPLDDPHGPPCVRCRREHKECILPDNKKRKVDRSMRLSKIENGLAENVDCQAGQNAMKSMDKDVPDGPSNPDMIDPRWKFEIGTMYNALEFLAKAAGSVAKEEQEPKAFQPANELNIGASPYERMNNIISDYMGSVDTSDESFLAPLVRPNGSQQAAVPLIEKLSSMRPKSSKKLTDVEYIGPLKLLSEDEANKLIDVFFLTMHPFFPHIPLQLQDSDELARYPILLCAILTIVARYSSFRELGFHDNDSSNRNIEVHEKLWIYCQRLISQTVWAEASTRSIGTVLAFLLFTEWNPRAIHWKWSDYANNLDLNDISKRDTNDSGAIKQVEGFGGMAAVRRSDRMAWMLTGTAVRLAQDMSFIDTSCKIFVATHIAETHTAINLNQRSILSESLSEVNRSILEREDDIGNENFYLEHILQKDESKERWTNFLQCMSDGRRAKGTGPLTDIERVFLNDEYVLYYVNAHNDSPRKVPSILPFPLKFSEIQRAKIELLRILTIGYESIYYDRQKFKTNLLNNDPRRVLTLLEIISVLIDRWYASYRGLLTPASGKPCDVEMCRNKKAVYDLTEKIDKESLRCEYNYCQLYVYSLALQGDLKHTKLNMSEITKSARYVELAYKAAKEMLDSAERIHALRMLRYMPIRWVTRIMRSVAFIVKCYMTMTRDGMAANPVASTILRLTVIPSEETVDMLQRAAATLREAAPDDLHLGTRYSKILIYLCAEVKMRSQMGDSEEHTQQQQQHQHQSQLNSERTKNQVPPLPLSSESTTNPATWSGRNASSNKTKVDTYSCDPELPFNDPFDWLTASDEMGLEFVDTWTEMIENRYMQDELGNLNGPQGGQT